MTIFNIHNPCATLRHFILLTCLIFGVFLTSVNLYGLSQDIRPPYFFSDELRFKNDINQTLDETLSAIKKTANESDVEFTARLTKTIAKGLAHIHWGKYENTKFNQLIPIWENYFIYFMGVFSGIPEYERYHFSDYKKSLTRGIGICGDASMIMSGILDENNIKNQILTFPGHIVLAAKFNNGEETIFDPDFGVSLGFNPEELKKNNLGAAEKYRAAGYTEVDVKYMENLYSQEHTKWDGVKHFITKKYYFEKVTYLLKWPLPIGMILFSLFYLTRKTKIGFK
jgi:hypothetical protein